MNGRMPFLLFTLDGQSYALGANVVERVIRAVEATPLPKAPGIVQGVINARGEIIPVINLRRRFGLPERAIRVSDRMIIAATSKRRVALVADSVRDVMEADERQISEPDQIAPGTSYVKGVMKLGDELVVIHDLETFLSLDEQTALDTAIEQGGKQKGDG